MESGNADRHLTATKRWDKRCAAATGLLLSAIVLHGGEADPPPLAITCDRPTALYQSGEMARFTIKLMDPKTAEGGVKWTMSKNGLSPFTSGVAPLRHGKATVSGTLDQPGFLLVSAIWERDGETRTFLAGAGFDVVKIQPSLAAPDDFDAFWNGKLAQLAGVPPNFRLTPVKSPRDGVEVFDLQASALGAPVSGYFAKPAGVKPKSLPAILTLHSAGIRSSNLELATDWAARGLLALDVNAHGIPNGQPAEYYQGLIDGTPAQIEGGDIVLRGYRAHGKKSRESMYFLGMFLRLVRAIDFLAQRPEWDGRTLIVCGTSQGGAQAIVAAALDPRVTLCVAGVPAMCDHAGRLAGRKPGWPGLTERRAAGVDPEVQEAAQYYDMVNFASRIGAECFFTVGFIDESCPPASVYAAYNNLRGKKEIFNDVASGHVNSPEAKEKMEQAILRHLAAQKWTRAVGNDSGAILQND